MSVQDMSIVCIPKGCILHSYIPTKAYFNPLRVSSSQNTLNSGEILHMGVKMCPHGCYNTFLRAKAIYIPFTPLMMQYCSVCSFIYAKRHSQVVQRICKLPLTAYSVLALHGAASEDTNVK